MPKLTVEGYAPVDVEAGKRLVLALEEDVKVDQLHACGGNARCTTCRVEFIEGEPDQLGAEFVLSGRHRCMRDGSLSHHEEPLLTPT